jgi:hypothetical protein
MNPLHHPGVPMAHRLLLLLPVLAVSAGCTGLGLEPMGTSPVPVDGTLDTGDGTAFERDERPAMTDTGVVDSGLGDGWSDDTAGEGPDQSGDCAMLVVGWTPAVAGTSQQLLGELVDADGEQVLIWDLRDESTGADPVGGSWDVCGLAFRGIGATDVDGDGSHDTWSSMVSGDGCTGTGTFTCAFGDATFAATHERRSDGCSTWCVPPALSGSLP